MQLEMQKPGEKCVYSRFPWHRFVVLAMVICCTVADAGADEESGFQSIFNAKELKDWDGDLDHWRVEDGAITGETTEENPLANNTFIIWRGGVLEDFELQLEYRIFSGNSGVQYRSFEVPDKKWVVGGYQADIEAGDRWSGANYGELFRGILAERGQRTVIGDDHKPKVTGEITSAAELQSHIRKMDWNTLHVIARGHHFTHKINGKVMSEVIDEDLSERRNRGILALQLHAGAPMKVQFRKIRLKRLPRDNSAAKTSEKKRIVFLAGKPSHGYGAHEFYAGCSLLAGVLRKNPGYSCDVVRNGYPRDATLLEGADAIVVYCDGGAGHPLIPQLEEFDAHMNRTVGLACLHYAVEVPKGEVGVKFLEWLGGYFEPHWSVNPHWKADFTRLPEHPICQGVRPFEIHDEWYYHMRFRDGMDGVTPILSANPPKTTLSRPDGPHSGNPHVRAAIERGEIQHLAWTAQRAGGGRSFGFTGGHSHWNWGDDNFRKLVCNAIVWLAGDDVPEGGVVSLPLTKERLEKNQDFPKPDTDSSNKKSSGNETKSGESAEANRTIPLPPADPSRGQEEDAPENLRDATQAVAQLDVADGLDLRLFASEPDIVSVTNCAVDHRGRVWVIEVANYRGYSGRRSEGDRILILEDTDGDGRADHQKVYYQGKDINSAMGIAVLGNRVIVSCSPNVLMFIDVDGDDRPDRRRVLFSKTGRRQHDHSAHSFVFGPDGRLYWNFGNTGQHVHDKHKNIVVDKSGNEIRDNGKPYWGGMVFRCNLNGREMEVLGHNFRNCYEVTIDSFGNLWQSDNDDDGNKSTRINFVMEFGNYGYLDEKTGDGWQIERTGWHSDVSKRHWHQNDPGVMPNLLITGAGSPTGITVYEGRLLPEPFWDRVIHADPGPRLVRACSVNSVGAGYEARVENLIEAPRDDWFRPVDVSVAPDGSIFVTDWYDPTVGGHKQGDLDRGRIFLVTVPGHQYRCPEFDFSTASGAAAALLNPNQDARYLAWTALRDMGRRAEPALREVYKSANPRHRARALWLLGQIKGRRARYVSKALQDKQPEIRALAVRLARQLKLNMPELLKSVVHDRSPQVRRECAIALRDESSEKVAGLWAELALLHDGQDRWYLEALGIGADQHWESCFREWLARVGDQWNSPAGRDIVWRSRASGALPLLAEIVNTPGESSHRKLRYMRSFDFHEGPEKEASLKRILEKKQTDGRLTMEAVRRIKGFDLDSSPAAKAAVLQYIRTRKGTDEFVALAAVFRIDELNPDLLDALIEEPDSSAGVNAAKLLLDRGGIDRLREVINGEQDEMVIAAITAIGLTQHPTVEELIRAIPFDQQRTLSVRTAATKALGRRLPGQTVLLDMVVNETLPPDLHFTVANILHSSADEQIRKKVSSYLDLPKDSQNETLPTLLQLVERRGDAERGKTLFNAAATCAKCHVVRGNGKAVGPELSEIGDKLSREAMFVSILDPNSGISHNYETYSVLLEDGVTLQGIKISDTPSAVTIKDTEAIVRVLPRDQIEIIKKQTTSLMPANLQKVLTTEQLVDVVEYMTTLKKEAAAAPN